MQTVGGELQPFPRAPPTGFLANHVQKAARRGVRSGPDPAPHVSASGSGSPTPDAQPGPARGRGAGAVAGGGGRYGARARAVEAFRRTGDGGTRGGGGHWSKSPTLRGLSFPICKMMVIIRHLPHRGGCEAAVTWGSRQENSEGAAREQSIITAARELGPPAPPPQSLQGQPRRAWAPPSLHCAPGPFPSVVPRLCGPPRLSRFLVQVPFLVTISPGKCCTNSTAPEPRACPPVPDTRKTATQKAKGVPQSPQPGWGPRGGDWWPLFVLCWSP